MWDPAGPIAREVLRTGTPIDQPFALIWQRLQAWGDRFRRATYWTDLRGSAQEGLSVSALTVQTFPDTGAFLIPCFRHDQSDDITFLFQFPHTWNGTAVRPHMHVMPLASGTGNLYVGVTYAWSTVGGKLTLAEQSAQSYYTYPLTPEDQDRHIKMVFNSIQPPDGEKTSAHLFIRVKRFAGGDTYHANKSWGTIQANVALLDVDIHYQSRLFGTEDEY